MRIVVDTMQSVCLDEFGGEKALSPASQETTVIQHIFGGQLQSQVICTKCTKVSNQLDNLMDLTVEIHGEVESLEECLDQFTVKEWLDGDNMYKCDGISVRTPYTILTTPSKEAQSTSNGCSSCVDESENCDSSLDLLAEKISDSQGVECRDIQDSEFVVAPYSSDISNDIPNPENGFSSRINSEAARPSANVDASGSYSFPEVDASSFQNVALHRSCNGSQNRDQGMMNGHDNGTAVPMEVSDQRVRMTSLLNQPPTISMFRWIRSWSISNPSQVKQPP